MESESDNASRNNCRLAVHAALARVRLRWPPRSHCSPKRTSHTRCPTPEFQESLECRVRGITNTVAPRKRTRLNSGCHSSESASPTRAAPATAVCGSAPCDGTHGSSITPSVMCAQLRSTSTCSTARRQPPRKPGPRLRPVGSHLAAMLLPDRVDQDSRYRKTVLRCGVSSGTASSPAHV